MKSAGATPERAWRRIARAELRSSPRWVRLALIAISSLLPLPVCAAMAIDSYPVSSLSDDGYGDIHFLSRLAASAIRNKYRYKAEVTSGDRCRAFYDIAFTLNDNDIKSFAEIALTKLASALRLTSTAKWMFEPYNQTAVTLRTNLDEDVRRMQWVGMSANLVHQSRFAALDGPPRTFIRGAEGQECFFAVQLQYFIKLEAPSFSHVVVIDTAARCRSPLLREDHFQFQEIDRAELTTWLDHLGIGHDYQQLLDRRLSELARPDAAGIPVLDEIIRVRGTDPYKEAVTHCRELLKSHQ